MYYLWGFWCLDFSQLKKSNWLTYVNVMMEDLNWNCQYIRLLLVVLL